MVKTFRAYLPTTAYRKYSCVHCRAHLASHDDLISKVAIYSEKVLNFIYLYTLPMLCYYISPALCLCLPFYIASIFIEG